MNCRTALKMTAAAGVAALVAPKVALANEDGLSWTHFPAGENGLQSVDDVVMAKVDDSATLTVDGYVLDIVPAAWIANLDAISQAHLRSLCPVT